jgi:hypothetical protein
MTYTPSPHLVAFLATTTAAGVAVKMMFTTARAASNHAVAPAIADMNSRLLIAASKPRYG